MALIGGGAGIVMLAATPWIKKLIGDVR